MAKEIIFQHYIFFRIKIKKELKMAKNQLVKYPEIEVQLVGEDGNAFAIMGRVTKAMKRAGISKEEIDNYRKDAMSGDYNNLLAVTMDWVTAN